MAERKVYVGSLGPHLYDDADAINDPDGDFAGLAGMMAVVTDGYVAAGGFALLDTNQSNVLTLAWNEDDDTDRVLNLLVGGGSRSLTINENFTIGDGSAGTLTYSSACTLTVELSSVLNQDLTTDAGPTFATLTLNSQAVADDARGLSSICKLVTNAKSDGIAGYFEGHIDGITDGVTYAVGCWLNIDSGSTTGADVRALDIGIYENGANCSGGNAYGLAIHMEFDSTTPPAAIYPFRLNTNQAAGHATPDALIFAANKKAIAVTESTFPGIANAYMKIVVQDGTVYRIPVVDESDVNGDVTTTGLGSFGTLKVGGDTNYQSIDANGVTTLAGTAKRAFHTRPQMDYVAQISHAKPTQVTIGKYKGYAFPVGGANEELFFREHVPHRWDGESDIIFWVLVAIGHNEVGAGGEDVGDKFQFRLAWEHSAIPGVLQTTSNNVDVETTILAGRNSEDDLYWLSFTLDYDIDGEGNEVSDGEEIGANLVRIAASANEVTYEPVVLDWVIQYQIDKYYGTGD